MEVVEMLEDDVFFAELSKRISLLITDDDEADFAAARFPASAAAPFPGFSLAHVPVGASMLAPPAYTLYHHAASYGAAGNNRGIGAGAGTAWHQQQQQQQQSCGSKGTGVFIPRSSPGSAPHSKKKGKSKGGAATNKAARAAQAASALPGKKQYSHK